MIYARRGFPFSQNQLRVLAYEMAVRDGQKGFSPIKRRAGRYWLKGFYQRFPEVRKKMAVNLLIVRAIGANPGQITKFFEEYKKWLDTWGLNYTPNRIWNVDECGLGDIPQPTAVVGITGECTFQTVSGEKLQNSTIVSCVSAGGMAMPPLIIFKANKIKPEWREAAPTGYMIRGSATGYINGRLSGIWRAFHPIFNREENLSRKQQSPVTTEHVQIASFQFGIHGKREVKEC